MIEFLCKLWPYLAGGLIGWLLAGWLARRFKYTQAPTEKLVDNPAHLNRIKELEAQLNTAKSSSNTTPVAAMAGGTTKTVDNPAHVKRISELEAQLESSRKGPQIDLAAAKAAGFKLKDKDDLTAIEGIGPKINDLIKADGVKSFAELADTPVSSIQTVLDKAGPRYQIANPGTWPDQANLAANNRWEALGALQDVLVGGVYPNASDKKASAGSSKSKPAKKSSKPKSDQELDTAAAKAAGFKVKPKNGQADFTVVEGVGPKINGLIHDAGIHSYTALGKTKVEALQEILDKAGSRYTLAKPGTWPAQADMAAANKWEALKTWQDELDGGK